MSAIHEITDAGKLAELIDDIWINPNLCHHTVAPKLEAVAAEIRRLTAEVAELREKLAKKAELLRGCYAADHKQKRRIGELEHALAECRDAYPAPEVGSGLEQLWAQSMGEPICVGAYVKARALSAAPAAQPEPVAWLVCSVNKDGSYSLEYAAPWREAAHEHINDAVLADIDGAATWVVRPAYITAPVAQPMTDVVRNALNLAFTMGQNYWADADSESYSANKRSDVTRQKFNAMRDEVCSQLDGIKEQP